MFKRYVFKAITAYLLLIGSGTSMAGGISADAGLTPSQDKWILRTQVRFMQRDNDPMPMKRQMETFMFPMVVAYGLRPELTVMVRQMYARMDMTMSGSTTRSTGFGDLFVMAKYRALRHNTRNYTIGIAPLLGFEFPTGKTPFTSDGVDMKTGVFFSWRNGPRAMELNLTYLLNGMAGGDDETVKSEEFELVAALARQITLTDNARTALAPVLELSYVNVTAGRINDIKQANSGESWIGVSPGVKLTHSSIILESLIRIPVWQNQIGKQPEIGIGALFGIRVFL